MAVTADIGAFFSGFMAKNCINAFDLQSVLSSYLGCEVKINQMVGQWHELHQQEQTRLASQALFEEQHVARHRYHAR
ncbi:type VI secretion system baseplate subunit TssG (plasmid) [Pseudoalteromonas espejiana]